MRAYVGIDIGLDGGIAVIAPEPLCHRQMTRQKREFGDYGIRMKTPMPTKKLGKGRTVDVSEIMYLLSGWSRAMVILEEAPHHAPSAKALRSLAIGHGLIEGAFITGGITYQTVTAPKWQREFWTRPKMAKGQKFDTKAQALAVADKLWPQQDWTMSDKARKPHDGMVDAALIAEYGRRKNL